MSELRVEATRGDLVESVHNVAAAVMTADGRLLAAGGDPTLVTAWRSAAKPFQALPLVADGAADAFGWGPAELALACASHSSEPMHLALARSMLARIGLGPGDLACGPHPPLSAEVAERVARQGIELTAEWSNCSGKHAGMLALARHRGWPTAGYERPGHPVQQRILVELARWTGEPQDAIIPATDGCTAVTFGIPLAAMALAWARLGVSAEPPPARIRQAMMAHPELVAGTGRLCTDLMGALPGKIVAKVGAAGIYCAALPEAGVGLALKVTDGDSAASGPALLSILTQLLEHTGMRHDLGDLASHAELDIVNTRGRRVGTLRAAGRLRFVSPPGGEPILDRLRSEVA